MADERQRQWTGQQIRKCRIAREMTQRDLATEIRERSGGMLGTVGQPSISHWERGLTEVSLRFRRRLAEALEVPHEILFDPPPVGWRETKAAA